MRILSFLLLAGALGLTACESGDGSGFITSKAGNRYQLFKENGSGDLPKAGEFAYFQASISTDGDSVLLDTRTTGGDAPVLKIAPDTVQDAQQIGPVEDVLRYMRVGDSAIVRVSLDKYPTKPPGMENDSVMVYKVVTTEIISEDEFNSRQAKLQEEAMAAQNAIRERGKDIETFAEDIYNQYKAGTLEGIQTTPSGLKYIIHEEGTGPQAQVNKGVVVQYLGKLVSDGRIFDQSFERGQGIPFPLGQGRVIPGWDEGIALLKEGARASLFIPSELAYGAAGAGSDIPPNSELMFYVELEEVQE